MIALAESVKWTEVVSAVSAAASAALAIAAALVAYFAGRAAWRSYGVQRKQLQRLEEDRLNDLASKFGVWVEYDESDASHKLYCHNGGAQPVYGVYITYDLKDPCDYDEVWCSKHLVPEPRTGLSGDYFLGDLGPTQEPRLLSHVTDAIREGIEYWADVATERRKSTIFPVTTWDAYKVIEITVTFTDAKGVSWERKGGHLRIDYEVQ
ncbi:hypothetical protein [Saccharopolyspora tripterygii]